MLINKRKLIISTNKQHTELRKLLGEARDLPSLPAVATNALKVMNDPRSSMKNISNIIASDQTITSRVLRIVNSAFYGFPRRITTISQALVVLGVEGLRSLIMGLSVQSMFKEETGNILWSHSVTTATIAKILAQKFGNAHPEESFVVGLIHDVGRLIFYQYFPKDFIQHGIIYNDSLSSLSKERELFGLDHGEVGYKLCTSWNIPDKLTEAIRYHHKPNMVKQNQILLMVCVAEGVSYYINDLDRIEELEEMPVLSNYVQEEFLERVGINEVPDQMINDIKSKVKDLLEVFSST